MVTLLGDCSLNYVLHLSPVLRFLFGWLEKVSLCCTVTDALWAYKQIQGKRDYCSNSARKENIMPGLLHQCIIIPSRNNRVISLPRNQKKYWHKQQAQTRCVLVLWYLHAIWPTPDVCQVLRIIHEVKVHFKLYKLHISIHASFFISDTFYRFCAVIWCFLNVDRWCVRQRMKHFPLHIKDY